jgi:hypothetical protein
MYKKWLKANSWFRGNWKRLLIIVVCLGLIFVHSTWSQLKFDNVNIWLGAIAIVFLLIPDLKFLLPYLRRIIRFNTGSFEFELSALNEEINKAEESIASNPDFELSKSIPPEVDEVLHEAGQDPRAALLLLSSKLETALRNRLEEADLLKGGKIPSYESLRLAARSGVFPEGVISAYQDFRQIRNKIAHDYTFQVDNNTILSLISLGTNLLKVLSAEKSDDKGMPLP